MADPRDPHAAERLAERRQKYDQAMADYRAENPTHLAPLAITNCQLCDDDGYRNNCVCDHIDRSASTARGVAKCREALANKQLRLDEPQR